MKRYKTFYRKINTRKCVKSSLWNESLFTVDSTLEMKTYVCQNLIQPCLLRQKRCQSSCSYRCFALWSPQVPSCCLMVLGFRSCCSFKERWVNTNKNFDISCNFSQWMGLWVGPGVDHCAIGHIDWDK